MNYSELEYKSRILSKAMDSEQAEYYLDIAERNKRKAGDLLLYGTLMAFLAGSMLLGLILLLTKEGERSQIGTDIFQKLFFASLPFTLLGTYLGYWAFKLQKKARVQTELFDKTLGIIRDETRDRDQ